MITKTEAVTLTHGQTLHCTFRKPCKVVTGPRGGRTEQVVRVRVSGQCQTWKTRPDAFRVPVKHGLYDNGEITERNGGDFHTSDACPAGIAF
jgi:hypothetical protein